MDFNDISSRLARTLNSLNARFDDEIAIYSTITKSKDEVTVLVTFGNEDEETIINKIFIILYNLSSLKDNVKKALEASNKDPIIVEEIINNSTHLQILIDLVNQEKHGYPLSRRSRSHKNPKLKNYRTAMSISSGTEPNSGFSLQTNSDGESRTQKIGNGNAKLKIVAQIFDGHDNYLFELDELVEIAYQKFNLVITENNL